MERVGIGYDVHPLVEGRLLVLGGVTVPSERGLAGHSDSDVAAHAIVDALLGAAALGDIGSHFPSDDPQLENASSMGFLEHAARLLADRQWRIKNVDATIIAQRPRLGPFTEQMRRNVGRALGIAVGQVSIKAKSANGMGFEGRGEGIAAQAVALIDQATP